VTRWGSVLISEDEERDKRRRWNPPRQATAGSANEQKRSFSSHTPGHDPTVVASASGPVPAPACVSGNRDTCYRELTPGHRNILPFLHRNVVLVACRSILRSLSHPTGPLQGGQSIPLEGCRSVGLGVIAEALCRAFLRPNLRIVGACRAAMPILFAQRRIDEGGVTVAVAVAADMRLLDIDRKATVGDLRDPWVRARFVDTDGKTADVAAGYSRTISGSTGITTPSITHGEATGPWTSIAGQAK